MTTETAATIIAVKRVLLLYTLKEGGYVFTRVCLSVWLSVR